MDGGGGGGGIMYYYLHEGEVGRQFVQRDHGVGCGQGRQRVTHLMINMEGREGGSL